MAVSCKSRHSAALKAETAVSEVDPSLESILTQEFYKVSDSISELISNQSDEPNNTSSQTETELNLGDIPKPESDQLKKMFSRSAENAEIACKDVRSDFKSHPCFTSLFDEVEILKNCMVKEINHCKDLHANNSDSITKCQCPNFLFFKNAIARIPAILNKEFPLHSMSCYNQMTYTAEDIKIGDFINPRTYTSTQSAHATFRGSKLEIQESVKEDLCKIIQKTSAILTDKELTKLSIDHSTAFPLSQNTNLARDLEVSGWRFANPDPANIVDPRPAAVKKSKSLDIHSYYRFKDWDQLDKSTFFSRLEASYSRKVEIEKGIVGQVVYYSSDKNSCSCLPEMTYPEGVSIQEAIGALDKFKLPAPLKRSDSLYSARIESNFGWYPSLEVVPGTEGTGKKVQFIKYKTLQDAKDACASFAGETDVWGLIPIFKNFKTKQNFANGKARLATPREILRIGTIFKDFQEDLKSVNQIYQPLVNSDGSQDIVFSDDTNGCAAFGLGTQRKVDGGACLVQMPLNKISYWPNLVTSRNYGAICVVN